MNYNVQPFFTRPTYIHIDKKSVIENVTAINKYINSKSKNKVGICAIIKSNAYGHGLCQIGSIISKISSVVMLGVTGIEEAICLREMGVKKQILLLGTLYPFTNFYYLLKYEIIPTVSSVTMLKELDKFAQKNKKIIKFHLKIDTGMGRIGFLADKIDSFIDSYKSCKNVVCDGVFTHFSSAAEDKEYTKCQLQLFNNCYHKLLISGIKPKYVHTANSAALLLYPESYFNMVRPGLLIYGMLPFKNAQKVIKVSPVLSLKSKIVFLKTVPKGTYISYSKTYCTKRITRVATIPIGYADGVLRKLSNRGKVLVNGKFCNIIGRVTMDMIMVDVTDVKNVNVGDEVVLIGEQNSNKITVEEVAEFAETINYEITTRLSERIPRIVV